MPFSLKTARKDKTMDKRYLNAIKEDFEEYDKKYTFIIQVPFELQYTLVHILEKWQQISDDEFDIEECMNEKIWCAIDWLEYIIDNIN